MATITLKRPSWCLQIPRSFRLFSVSFTTVLPQQGHPCNLPSFPHPIPTSSTFRHRIKPGESSKTKALDIRRREFTNTSSYQAQQQQATDASSLNPQTAPASEAITPNVDDLSGGLNDKSLDLNDTSGYVDWTRSFQGLSNEAFSPDAAKVLLAPISPDDIEIKPDGIIYLPEIKYRRILNQAFGPGGWGLAPRGETIVTQKAVTREYALVALGRFVKSGSRLLYISLTWRIG